MIVGKAKRLLAAAIAVLMIGQMILASTDWSKEVVESNMKRYPTAESLKGWGYAKSLYLYCEYLVYTDERDAKNNHGTCWTMQVAEFARYTGDQALMTACRHRFKTLHVPGQIAAAGSFPLELRRTKPYGYSLFNLEAMAGICQTLSTPEDSLWKFELPDGRSMRKAMEYMVPFIEDKKRWTKPADVMYFDQWPVRQASLLFAGLALNKPEYIALWRKLNPDPTVEETVRNYPIRRPVLWV